MDDVGLVAGVPLLHVVRVGRLEASAGVGEVVISGTTFELLGDAVVAESLGELELKGKAEPVAAYRLARLRS